MKLASAAATGEEVQLLRALRDDLARKLDKCQSMRDYAALSLRLLDTAKRLSELEGGKPVGKSTVLDELAKRRAERRTGT